LLAINSSAAVHEEDDTPIENVFGGKASKLVNTHGFHSKYRAIHPTRGFRAHWDILILIAMIYTGIFVPFEIALSPLMDKDGHLLNTITSILNNVVFFADILLNFITAYQVKPGRYEYKTV
jgi:hypothetical protein